MTIIQKYIEFLREYNKLLERGSKNVLRLNNTLWIEDLVGSSVILKNNFDSLFVASESKINSLVLLETKRPLGKKDDEDKNEETFQEKFDKETYSFLYKAARDSKKNSSLEFIYSFGLFHLKLGETIVKVHLLHIPLSASINGDRVSFSLHSEEDPYIDSFFLNHPEIDREELLILSDKFEAGIEQEGINYLNTSDFKQLISYDTLALHQSLVFNSEQTKPLDNLTTNFVQFSPCLILRRKRPRHFQNLMNNIIDYTKSHEIKPSVLDILLKQKENSSTNNTHYFTNIYEKNKDKIPYLDTSDFEQFFPLPFNKEQLEIYNNYKTHDLSVVTGPPGTGKSHSIVNLLCAMLAEGKRILITAKTDKALESLLDKIPEQFKGLVMADIRQQNQSDYTLSNSVDNIRHLLLEKTNYTIDVDLERLNESKKLYNQEKAALAQLLSQEYENLKIPYFEREFSVYELYLFVETRKIEWDFIKDNINQDTIISAPKIIKKLKRFVELLPIEKFFTPIDLSELLSLINQIELKSYDLLKEKLVVKLKQLEISSLKEFNIQSVEGLIKSLEVYKNESLIVEDDEILNAINKKKLNLNVVENEYIINRAPLEIKENYPKYLRDISTYLALIPEGKEQMSFFQKNFSSVYKELKYIEQITINDEFCNNRKRLLELRKFLNIFSKLNIIIEQLAKHKFISYTHSEQCNLLEMRQAIDKGLDKVSVNVDVLRKLKNNSINEFAKNYELELFDIERLVSKANLLVNVYKEALDIRDRKDLIKNAITKSKKSLTKLKIEGFDNDDDLKRVQVELKKLKSAKDAYSEFEETSKFLLNYLPLTIEHLDQISDPNSLAITQDSLQLKIASQKVEEITSLDVQKTSERLLYATEQIKLCKSDILSGLSKENFRNRFNEAEKNAFVNLLSKFDYEFKQSKRGIADKDKFRRNAQQTAKQIAPNISCWVMKFDDVLKTLDTSPEVFDCVITDEASQLNFNSLLLGYYSKKMIVVGDEKQTSPEDISITNEAFDSLRKNNLDFLGADAINIRADASLFSLSNLVAGTTNQMLREHFRCVPELIEFSKKFFYEDKLVPLKVLVADRLTPKIRIKVDDAYFDDKIVNKEILAISKKLKSMIEDPVYNNKTIGVISLGYSKHTQALKTLIEDFSIKSLEKHNIVIDNPSEFQGDERDVIIISLGVANSINEDYSVSPPSSIVDNIANNLTSGLRGINVGLSRAKEQMILFHSLELDELKSNDFRRKIISFFNEKFVPVSPIQLPPNLEKKYRIPENRPKPFDSWFEFDIASSLYENGFHHIVPQYKVKRKELFHNPRLGRETYVHFIVDLVVYNNGTPLAIECDGDAFHTSTEDVAYDIERQEFLERIGWKIHRVTYSSFKIDPKKEIDKLINFIKRNSIQQKIVQHNIHNDNNDYEALKEEGVITLDNNVELNIEPEEAKILEKTKDDNVLLSNETPLDLFSIQDFNANSLNHRQIAVNDKCRIVMIDLNNKIEDVILMDIPRNQQPKSRDGIQILSIYSDLGMLLLGNNAGDILKFPERNQRVKVEKIF